jgi:hypothetical protein
MLGRLRRVRLALDSHQAARSEFPLVQFRRVQRLLLVFDPDRYDELDLC